MSVSQLRAWEPQTLEEELSHLQQQVAEQLPAELHSKLSRAIGDHIQSNPAMAAASVGQSAPDFTLPDLHGHLVTLSRLLRAGPVVLSFYRGSWCPFCDLTLRAYSRMLPQLQRAGAQLLAVSPQRGDIQAPNAIEHGGLGFPVLSDAASAVSRRYGLVYSLDSPMSSVLKSFGLDLAHINGTKSLELPVPATYIVAADGTIRWSHVEADYRVRAEPAQILRALSEL